MTRDDILALTGRELDAAVAKNVMGLDIETFNGITSCKDKTPTGYVTWRQVCRYSSDRNAAALVLAEIERRGLCYAFCRRFVQVGPTPDRDYEVQWACLTASPADICRAALLAVEGE